MKVDYQDRDLIVAIGNRIREVRKHLGWSQEKLAIKATLHRTFIGQVERGERNLTIVSANKLARTLGMELSELFKFE